MKKVKCIVCANSNGKKCAIKQASVSQKKSRKCADFEFDVDKVQVKNSPPAEYIPYHLRSRKAYKKYLEAEELKAMEAEVAKQVDFASPDVLSRFRSSVGVEDA